MKKSSLYSPFQTSLFSPSGGTFSILKDTKSLLRNEDKFSGYLTKYSSKTTVSTFMSPDQTEYPIIRENYKELIPLTFSCVKSHQHRDTESINKKTSSLLLELRKLRGGGKNFEKKCRSNIERILSEKEEKKNKFKDKENKRYNIIFNDLFFKWQNRNRIINKNDNDDGSKIIINNSHYTSLIYDDNLIFHSDYSKFLEERLEALTSGGSENSQNSQIELTSKFLDKGNKDLDIKIKSMRLVFEKIGEEDNVKEGISEVSEEAYSSENEEENNNCKKKDLKRQVINIPLSYVFLFMYKGIDYFKNILLSCIKFSDNFTKVHFDDNELYSYLKKGIQRTPTNKNFNIEKRGHNILPLSPSSIKRFCTMGIQYQNNNNSSNSNINTVQSPKRTSGKNLKKVGSNTSNTNVVNEDFKKESVKNISQIGKQGSKKNGSRRSFSKVRNSLCRQEEYIPLENYENIHCDKSNMGKSKDYSEYEFIWETPTTSFLVSLFLPIFSLKYSPLPFVVETLCDKSLFLHMFKLNFVNWDFFALNFFVSLKAFRELVLRKMSRCTTFRVFKGINENEKKEEDKTYYINLEEDIIEGDITGRKAKIEKLNKNKKNWDGDYTMGIGDIGGISEISEGKVILKSGIGKVKWFRKGAEYMRFFVTDKKGYNSLFTLHSFEILLSFSGYLRFHPKRILLPLRRMPFLLRVSRYEALAPFLFKLVRGFSLNIDTLDGFDPEILNYQREKGNTSNSNNWSKGNIWEGKSRDKNNEENVKVEVRWPNVEIERIIKGEMDTYNVELNPSSVSLLLSKEAQFWPKVLLKDINISETSKKEILKYPKFSGLQFQTKLSKGYRTSFNLQGNDTDGGTMKIKRNFRTLKSHKF